MERTSDLILNLGILLGLGLIGVGCIFALYLINTGYNELICAIAIILGVVIIIGSIIVSYIYRNKEDNIIE